jgi:hypothetical protein
LRNIHKLRKNEQWHVLRHTCCLRCVTCAVCVTRAVRVTRAVSQWDSKMKMKQKQAFALWLSEAWKL